MSPKVILIGGNHHNGLGLAREFGRHGIRPYGLIVGQDSKRSFVRSSRYWEKTWYASTDVEAIETAVSLFDEETEKPVLIPWSDSAAEAIDLQLDSLSKQFILPSINNQQGEIARLMDKLAQTHFASEHGLKMLPSEIIDLTTDVMGIGIDMPVILKPVTSVEGKKSDMLICKNSDDLKSAVKVLREKSFSRILAQYYMPEREEYVLTGAISKLRSSFSVARRIRQWPPNFGTGSFSDFATSVSVTEFCTEVLNVLSDIGYSGPIDFELFGAASGELYVNEINWRSSGRNFVSLYTGVPSTFMWYCDVIGREFEAPLINTKNGYSMNEATDPKHVISRRISLLQWMKDVRRTNSFAVWAPDDPAPAFWRYLQMASKAFR